MMYTCFKYKFPSGIKTYAWFFLIHYRNLKRLILVEISFEEIKCYEICLLCVDTKLIHVALKNIFRIIKKNKKKNT